MTGASYLPQEIIRRKRDGMTLGEEEIAFFVRGLTDGSIAEGQAAAFAMAVVLRGMTMAERIALTRAMTGSGAVLDWSALGASGPVLDKHSTGGVGDKVSLVLAPVVAACGAVVPMIAGRGLGHTGGTIDKLESIPGYDVQPGIERLRDAVDMAGCAIVGQTPDLAPADRRLYAIRDVTATVESIPLITASILSKKLAAGIQGLVMDVKVGSGAFATTIEAARELAESLVAVARGAGLPTVALLTDMDQVLGRSAGNALEVREAIRHLTGRARDPRLHRLIMALGAEMLLLGRLAGDRAAAEAALTRALDSGAAAERFQRMVTALGGPSDLVAAPDRYLLEAPVRRRVAADRAGMIVAVEVRALGLVVVALGGGRRRASDAVDHRVGLDEVAGLGEAVGPDRPLAVVHARSDDEADRAADAVRAAFKIGAEPDGPGPIVRERIGGP